jgi:hypothetical protein
MRNGECGVRSRHNAESPQCGVRSAERGVLHLPSSILTALARVPWCLGGEKPVLGGTRGWPDISRATVGSGDLAPLGLGGVWAGVEFYKDVAPTALGGVPEQNACVTKMPRLRRSGVVLVQRLLQRCRAYGARGCAGTKCVRNNDAAPTALGWSWSNGFYKDVAPTALGGVPEQNACVTKMPRLRRWGGLGPTGSTKMSRLRRLGCLGRGGFYKDVAPTALGGVLAGAGSTKMSRLRRSGVVLVQRLLQRCRAYGARGVQEQNLRATTMPRLRRSGRCTTSAR